MLNDLALIERGLAAHGVPLTDRHPDVKEMAKGQMLRVRMAADGTIDDIERIGGNGTVWTLRDGQQNGFPGLKTDAGLLPLDTVAREAHKQAWNADKSPAGRRRELERLIATVGPPRFENEAWPKAGHRKRIAERLDQLRPLAADPLAASVPACLERFLRGLPSFLPNLAAALFKKLDNGDDGWLDIVQAALTGPVPLVIDVAVDDFALNASDSRQVAAVSAALSPPAGMGGADGDGGIQGFCALSGRETALHRGNFPQPNLPGLGQSYIFARNGDIPSLARYNRTGAASFPLASDLAPRLNAVFGALIAPESKGRTWRLIPPEIGDKPDLLIVSLPAAAGEPMANALAEDSGEDEFDEQTDGADAIGGVDLLRELASRVIGHSHGEDRHGHTPGDMTVLVLRAVDPANRKAIYHRQTGARALFDAATRWEAATGNVPDGIAFPVPVKGQRAPVPRTPPRVAPLSITRLSCMQFVNGGRRRLSVAGIPAGDAFELFLGNGAVERRARTLLRLLLRRHSALFGGLAAARSKGTDHLKDFDPKGDLRRDALRSISWIGVLLHHLGHQKEDYMTGTAFRLGQLLAGADTIHIGYCADLRGGDTPPSLVGNAVLTIAGTRPQRALAILQSRLKPYLAWAKRGEYLRERARKLRHGALTEDDAKKNKRLSGAIWDAILCAPQLKELIDDIREEDLDNRQDDAFKAELLLGYLAGLPRPAGGKPGTSNDSTGTEQTEETSA